jgi:aspartate/methionine/tyrosine aminotransferase
MLAEYGIRPAEILNEWWPSLLELVLDKRNRRIRRENGEEESEIVTENWGFSDFEAAAERRRAMRKSGANRNQRRGA